MINGKSSSVRHNLWLLLQHLLTCKKQLVENDQLRLRADAICIDQSDSFEKSCQVHLMSRIFRQADSVFAWLGWTTSHSTKVGFTALRFFGRERVESKEATPRTVRRREDYLDNFRKYDIHYPLQAVLHLLRSRYWSRRSVVQELILAREFTVISDLDDLPWFNFANFFYRLQKIDYQVKTLSREQQEKTCLTLQDIIETVPYKIWLRHQPSLVCTSRGAGLARVLRAFRNNFCELELDKIYSLLSLIPDGNKLPVDYDCSREQLVSRIYSPFRPQRVSDWICLHSPNFWKSWMALC